MLHFKIIDPLEIWKLQWSNSAIVIYDSKVKSGRTILEHFKYNLLNSKFQPEKASNLCMIYL